MVRIVIGINGMTCGMCEAHINEAIRNAFQVKKVTSSRARKQTVILAGQEISGQEIKDVIAKAGYEVVSVTSGPYEKKGAFRLCSGDGCLEMKREVEHYDDQ